MNLFFKDFIYLFIRDTERETETQAKGKAGSLQGAWCGTWPQDSGIMTWAKGRVSTTEPPRFPQNPGLLNIPQHFVSWRGRGSVAPVTPGLGSTCVGAALVSAVPSWGLTHLALMPALPFVCCVSMPVTLCLGILSCKMGIMVTTPSWCYRDDKVKWDTAPGPEGAFDECWHSFISFSFFEI